MIHSPENIRKVLENRLKELRSSEGDGAENRAIVTLDQQSMGRLSRMDALQRQAMAAATERRRVAELARVEAALGRLSDGEYGYCQDCGEEITEARLAFDPAVALCISCAKG